MSRQLKEDRVTANLGFFFIEIDKLGIPPPSGLRQIYKCISFHLMFGRVID